ncbi:variant erythrocyte surface antigen-1 alpha subunit [Babesia bovis T2Bo]|uniref:Variant erythrocyte surface antigen-1, alpha subunit n=1 Tax=Babesia bovis TaxID=5865 RepID=A7AP45_BABBO|nr:variant erythrocyte surface antigen-1 alpha subunit [Babesia bovis T2Bo]EDO08329.1 variant erythrocyte surface antigen-1 alpha subunit [Babesia bovis T2Bo]|eukprot:XP_001611897.1 variant erythrocyte surface antigen-1, alpha subunit [Babesia bovis T2Bo]
MAVNSTFTPKASLTEAPTNLKEAIDWVLRVTGKDGKKLGDGECICGLAAAVTDLLQSVQLEYHGYEGDVKNGAENSNSGATKADVDSRLNDLFSLVQGLGGTSVVRTYIDQLAQVLSALVGWSKIEKCWEGKNECKKGNKEHHGQNGECKYLKDIESENKCGDCGCMKYVVIPSVDWVQLGRGCTKCKGSGTDEEAKKQGCQCDTDDEEGCSAGNECKCALAGKCCKCCCKGKQCGCQDAKCICCTEDKNDDTKKLGRPTFHDSYQSAYGEMNFISIYDGSDYRISSTWTDLVERGGSKTPSQRRHHCARILLGSVCLIWSGLTYMYWTGKWTKGSPYWNNHILDGSGLDDGTLSQWLQALGFPKTMLNNHGPKNRLDQVIWDGFRDMFFLGFLEPSGLGDGVSDTNGNTARSPYGMNYAGFVHTAHRDSFNTDQADVFKDNGTAQGINQHKNGAIFKLYILSCAYFTGLQKRNSESTPRTPRTIREILYWLSALPYSKAYKYMLEYAKEVLKKKAPDVDGKKQLSFYQTGRWAPITVDEYNLFAHFQAVTQYCPLVLIGIQGGLHSTDSSTPAIHSLYANTECNFTYPTVSIQAYNQVVHYIRALFYQLYFLRKQCAVKVACGGKWRECRYGKDVESKGVISWMCLGCNPMEHDRKCRVEKLRKGLVGVENELKRLYYGTSGTLSGSLKTLLEKIGEVVVQLGNAQEVLEKKAENKAIEGVKVALGKAKKELEKARTGLEKAVKVNGGLTGKLTEAKNKLDALTKNGGGGALDTLANGSHAGSLQQITSEAQKWRKDYSSAKDRISEVIHKVLEVLTTLKEGVKEKIKEEMNGHEKALNDAIDKLKDICNSPKCPPCNDHINKCGRQGEKKTCPTCHQQYMDGFPSPLQAFLEDRLPGFSCNTTMELLEKWEASKAGSTPSSDEYPPAASHLGHCGGSGQCCPLPMGFRNSFYKGSTTDCTGQRLYGILYFFSNENMMQSCVYTLVRVTAALSATTPQVLGDVFGFFRGGVGEKESGMNKNGREGIKCNHTGDPSKKGDDDYVCGWCASGLRDEVKQIEWIQTVMGGKDYRETVGNALIEIKGDKGTVSAYSSNGTSPSALSTLTKDSEYLSPLTGELYTAVSATFGGTYLSWVLYLSDALQWGLKSLTSEFLQIECRGCKGQCDPNKCKKGEHGQKSTGNSGQCGCQSIVSCTGVLPVLYRHGFSYGNPFNLEGFEQENKEKGDYSIDNKGGKKRCHEFLESLKKVIESTEKDQQKDTKEHPLTNLLSQVGQLQYDIRLPWIFVLTLAWLMAVLYLAFGAIWPLDWTHMRSHWLRGGEHQWQCMWYKVMTGRKGMELVEYFGRKEVKKDNRTLRTVFLSGAKGWGGG